MLRSPYGLISGMVNFQKIKCVFRYPTRPRSFYLRSKSSSASLTSDTLHASPRGAPRPWIYPTTLFLVGIGGLASYHYSDDFRHSVLAMVRSSRVAQAAVLGILDYKITLSRNYPSQEEHDKALSGCHTRSALRVRQALLLNGGIFIKLGQHMASMIILPVEWSSTMRPLQDQCDPTSYEDLQAMFISDLGTPIEETFEMFNFKPIGVASLAQVHVAVLKDGQKVAVKLQHPHLAEFADVDMKMVERSLHAIKWVFPEFEFTWLGDEMKINLPKEMDFTHEASNAIKLKNQFASLKTTLYIPKIINAYKRVLVMEFIEGARPDNLEYLAEHNIDRNRISLELAEIFGQMIHLNGFFHADPHPGNLLIRPSPPSSTSPRNFEIVLLDHGQYFYVDPDTRVNYSKFWLSLMKPASSFIIAERRRLAKLVANVPEDLYPIFEAALTGRTEGSWDQSVDTMINIPQTQSEQEREHIRQAVATREGLILDVFDVLRRVPRIMLMIFKVNDLLRGLDHDLMTTHSNIRVFLVTAKYCMRAVWVDDTERLSRAKIGLLNFLYQYATGWWSFKKDYYSLTLVETVMDTKASVIKFWAWLHGLRRGFRAAHAAASGLSATR
ncbi:atypical/ABC1/ABC1-B protein kinase [Dendrothele bispora CBS 962.96]|uniref:Atypical/ABC1/ABC1-B protein kinase n=1 Tax=Dendrothele bispora (strain CBS 962.96) TaxID=1314807 RepID=A0A4S8MPR8_DENBC|nr:atypical/ABC1/ABC1-B protein kinase [Dendrothele bispora CBS 962.96]